MSTLQEDFGQFLNMVIDDAATKMDGSEGLGYFIASMSAAVKTLAGQIDALRSELREKGVEVASKFEPNLATG